MILYRQMPVSAQEADQPIRELRLKWTTRVENTMETVEHSLIRMFREGPEVS